MPQTFHYEAIDSTGRVHKRSTKVESRRYTACVVSEGHWPKGWNLEGDRAKWLKAEFRTGAARPMPLTGNVERSEVVPAKLVKVTGKA